MSGEKPLAADPKKVGADESLPAIDFATFILSLTHSAHVHFDDAPSLAPEETWRSLAMAKQSIDLLVLLQEKTRGNLTGEEERLLAQAIFELTHQHAEARAKAARGA